MEMHSQIFADIAELRSQLRERGSPHSALLRLSPMRPAIDLAFDCAVCLASVFAATEVGLWLVPIVLIVVGNRQRALGNILHDAAHHNISRSRRWNDWLTRAFIAPLTFSSLTTYRQTHFKHHIDLGVRSRDPDLLPAPARSPDRWQESFVRILLAWQSWLGSLLGHLAPHQTSRQSKLFILLWWALASALLWASAGFEFLIAFLALWLTARATTFHAITTIREMCDHFGMHPGGVFSFTRDMPCSGVWRWLIHPRNNGYHLTHHLLPAVPYYHLPEAHALFKRMPIYQGRAVICKGYFMAEDAVICAWQR